MRLASREFVVAGFVLSGRIRASAVEREPVMTAEKSTMAFGWRVYGLGVMALGVVCLVWRSLVLGQTVPDGFPGRIAVVCAAGMLMLIAGAAMEWRRSAAWGAMGLSVYTLVMMVVLNGPVLPHNYRALGAYFGVAESLAIAAGGLIVYAASARMEGALSLRLMRVARMTFGVCALFFGSAHFVYMNFTAPLVPKWLPPSQVFWGYTTGVCFVAAGVAILTGVKARLAAILLTGMLASFTFLVHVRILLADHSGVFNWSELALNITLVGVAWVVADSLAAVPSWSDSNGR